MPSRSAAAAEVRWSHRAAGLVVLPESLLAAVPERVATVLCLFYQPFKLAAPEPCADFGEGFSGGLFAQQESDFFVFLLVPAHQQQRQYEKW